MMNSELFAYLRKHADERESYLLLDDSLRVMENNLLPESLRGTLSPGASLHPYISEEDLSACRTLLASPCEAECPGVICCLSALTGFAYAYATLLPFFAKRYLILYLFEDRLTMQRSRAVYAPLTELLSRIVRNQSETAFTSFESALENESSPKVLSRAAVSLFTTSAMLADFLRLPNTKEVPLSVFDLNALVGRIIDSGFEAQPFGDILLKRQNGNDTEDFLPVKLSLPYFMKLVAACLSVIAYLSNTQEISLSTRRYDESAYALRFTASSSMTPLLIGHSSDFFRLIHRVPEAALPLALADHISALLGISLLVIPEPAEKTISLSLIIRETLPATEEFKSRDQFAEYDASLKEACRLFFGKRL